MDHIFVVIPITVKNDELSDSRIMGWYPSYEEAETAIIHNDYDLSEDGSFTHIVVEQIAKGVYSPVISENWFTWNGTNYISCDKPVWSKGLNNWSNGVTNWGFG